MDERKQPTGLFIVVTLGVLVCYVLGLGPACWVSSRVGGGRIVTIAYRPLTWAVEASGNWFLTEKLQMYSQWGAPCCWGWTFLSGEAGHAEWSPVQFDTSGPSPPPVSASR
jgi:hypothetical protein